MGTLARHFDAGDNAGDWRNAPFKGRLEYPRTPLIEFMVGYRLTSFMKWAFSYQHQGPTAFQTEALPSFHPRQGQRPSLNNCIQLSSLLSLDALQLKGLFELPFSLIFKSVSLSPYLGLSIGPGWQTFSQVQVDYMAETRSFVGHVLPLRQKISCNAVFGVDLVAFGRA